MENDKKIYRILKRIGFSAVGAGLGSVVAGPFGAYMGAASVSALSELAKCSFESISNGLFLSDSDKKFSLDFTWRYWMQNVLGKDPNNLNFCDLYFYEQRNVLDMSRVHGELNALLAILYLYNIFRKINGSETVMDGLIACENAAYYASGIRDSAIFKGSRRSAVVKIANIFDCKNQNTIYSSIPEDVESVLYSSCPVNMRETFYLGWIRNCEVMWGEFSVRSDQLVPFATAETILRSRAMAILLDTYLKGQASEDERAPRP